MKSSKKITPFPLRSYFLSRMSMIPSFKRYPNVISAVFNSFLSIFPELSLSNERKQFCQSVTYFHKAPKSSNDTCPRLCLSNMPIISRTVSGLNGVHVPLERATCNSSAEMYPLRSRSTLLNTSHRNSLDGICDANAMTNSGLLTRD